MFYLDYWQPVKDGNAQAAALYRRHYSCHEYKDGRRDRYGYRNRHMIVGPGYKVVLLGQDGQSLCCWRRGTDASGQEGISCTVLRNESNVIGSELLLEAECWALRKWPDAWRFYTFINPKSVQGNPPGNVFRRAGWADVGRTQGGLIILAKVIPEQAAQRSAAALILEYEGAN